MPHPKSRAFAISILGIFFFLASALLIGGGCSKTESPPAERTIAKAQPVSYRPFLNSDLIEGRKVFEEKHCSQCHSIFERERKIGPKLQSSKFYGSFLDIFSILWNHAPAMAVHMRKEVLDRPQFSTAELNQLVSFLYMLPYLSQPGDPRKGENLLKEKACFQCHSLGYKGKRDGIRLDSLSAHQSQVVLLTRMWNHGPVMLTEMAKAGTPIPRFSGDEFADLFAALTRETREQKRIFLGVGDVDNGHALFSSKGCVKCHSVLGKGGKEAPDLGRAISRSNVTIITTRMWNHAAEMREKFREKKLEWPRFSDTEMNDLIVYLFSLQYDDGPGDPAEGEKVFTRERCVECHFGTDAEKKKILKDTRAVGSVQFATILWNHIPAMEAAMITRGVDWPAMTGEQMRDVLAYLQSQE